SIINNLINDLFELISCVRKIDYAHKASGHTCSISCTSIRIVLQVHKLQMQKPPEGGFLHLGCPGRNRTTDTWTLNPDLMPSRGGLMPPLRQR
ncbi:MAG: hypothetical protein ACK5BB_00020, partial [Burkholderiaceae bacterium]